MAPVVYGFSPWLITFVMLADTTKGSWFVAPRLYSNYLFGLMLHQLYLAVSIIGMLNKLHHTNISQDSTFQINYITAIVHLIDRLNQDCYINNHI